MMGLGIYLGAILALVASPTASAVATAPSSVKILAELKRSPLPLTKGSEDCPALAEHYTTLGALVSAHEKLANREREASCQPARSPAGVLACTAQFSNRVPPSRSEEEFTLRLEFEMKGSKVLALKCFFAG
jgi:hypothetical protein